jgi:heme-degrading monooxygenase HmoA
MIACIWRCITQASLAESYLDNLIRNVVSPYQSAAGNQGVFVLNEIQEDVAHFLLLSFWDSSEAFLRFTSQAPETSIPYTESEEYMLAYESTIKKYHVASAGYSHKSSFTQPEE